MQIERALGLKYTDVGSRCSFLVCGFKFQKDSKGCAPVYTLDHCQRIRTGRQLADGYTPSSVTRYSEILYCNERECSTHERLFDTHQDPDNQALVSITHIHDLIVVPSRAVFFMDPQCAKFRQRVRVGFQTLQAPAAGKPRLAGPGT